jgi:hypothetical protein
LYIAINRAIVALFFISHFVVFENFVHAYDRY